MKKKWIVHGTNEVKNRATVTVYARNAYDAIAVAAGKGVYSDRPVEKVNEIRAMGRRIVWSFFLVVGVLAFPKIVSWLISLI